MDNITLNDGVDAFAVGEVLESRNADYQQGDFVTGMLDWGCYAVAKGGIDRLGMPINKVPGPEFAPLSYHLGILGMPGATAYIGIETILEPKEGETVFITAASGAVGTVVGQIAKSMGCRVVGSAGADDKVELLISKFGFDAAFNYKTVSDYDAKIKELCPGGIDCSFENTGGDVAQAVFNNLNHLGRMAVCGAIAEYGKESEDITGPNFNSYCGRNVRVQSFLVSDHFDLWEEWSGKGSELLQQGKLVYEETVIEGVENIPQAFLDMMIGKAKGKVVVKVG